MLSHSKAIRGAVASGLLFTSFSAYSQVTASREATMRDGEFSIELKPLTTGLSAIAGVGSIGLGGEFATGGNISGFADVYTMNANLPNRLRNEGRESDVPVVQKLVGYSGDIGSRYYMHPGPSDSWYGGAKVSYNFIQSQWGYQGEKIDHSVRTVSPGVEAGYRWIWRNGVLVRLGAGVDDNVVQDNSSASLGRETAVTSDAEEKVKGYAKTSVTPRVDMGLGYAF